MPYDRLDLTDEWHSRLQYDLHLRRIARSIGIFSSSRWNPGVDPAPLPPVAARGLCFNVN